MLLTPRRHSSREFLNAKLARIGEPHVAPLNEMVRLLRAEHPEVPFFDPGDGGTNARVLFLLEAPGPKANTFVSCDNDDQTAENTFRLLQEAGLPREEIVLWNVVPFYIGEADRSKLRAARKSDLDAGRPWIVELLTLLPSLDTVLLLGNPARKAASVIRERRPMLRIVESWHPSNLSLNREPTRRPQLLEALRAARAPEGPF